MGQAAGVDELDDTPSDQEDLHLSVCAAELLLLCQSDESSWLKVQSFIPELIEGKVSGREDAVKLKDALAASEGRRIKRLHEWNLEIKEWCTLAKFANASLLDLLPDRPIPSWIPVHPLFSEVSRRRARLGKSLLKHKLQDALRQAADDEQKLPLYRYLLEIGCSSSTAYRCYPEIAKKVGQRFLTAQSVRRARDQLELRERIDNAINELTQQCATVSLRAVAEIVDRRNNIASLSKIYTQVRNARPGPPSQS